jgi:hypothetical protein
MFITPTPPTIKPTLETANIKIKTAPVTCSTRRKASLSKHRKLSGLSAETLRRRRSNCGSRRWPWAYRRAKWL